MSLFEPAVEALLRKEKGYVNDPNDPGGETNFGISKRSYPKLDIKNLTINEAKNIYLHDWWIPYAYKRIADQNLANQVLQASVNIGPIQTHRILQTALNNCGQNVIVDGLLGDSTFNDIFNLNGNSVMLVMSFKLETIKYYVNLCNKFPQDTRYLLGWCNRVLK